MKRDHGNTEDPHLSARKPFAAAEPLRPFTSPEAPLPKEEEQELRNLLARLPDTPMPVDFTKRVLCALDERPTETRVFAWRDLLRSRTGAPAWNLRWAAAAAVVLLAAGLWIRHDAYERRHLAASVAAVTRPVQEVAVATQLPPVEILRDFEFIDQMRRLSALADEEFLASLEPVSP